MPARNLLTPRPTPSVLKRAAFRLRRASEKMGLTSPARIEVKPGFFDQYPRFYSTSVLNAIPQRLNERYRALIAANESLIRDRTILDMGAHDGRWSFAALKAGARHVIGIEGRPHLVEYSIATMQEYGIAAERYRFVAGDVFDQIDLVPTGSIDTLFCFGFFYHTANHMLLLSKIARMNPQHLILDTDIYGSSTDCAVFLKMEEIAHEGSSIVSQPADPLHSLVGKPSRSALETMLTSFGWSFSYYDWHRAGITNWNGLSDYQGGWRVSLVASRSSSPGSTLVA
jgi:predicted nicotinamide N-methyase